MKIILLAKEPLPGKVKTRLCPPCSPEQAARLASAAIEDTVAAIEATGVDAVAAFDGNPSAYVPASFGGIEQRGKGLAERLASAFEDVGAPAVLVGMDTPQLSPALLVSAIERLETCDAVLGPTLDGGYWLIGFRRLDQRAFEGVPMSTERTYGSQLARLEQLGLSCAILPVLRDVDNFSDAAAVSRSIPNSRFARALGGLHSSAVFGAVLV